MFTLYTTALSANGRKTLALVDHLGLDADVRRVNVYAGEGQAPAYLAVNPLGKIPSLVDGDLVLWESNAILLYVSEAHGNFGLYSREPARRAEVARWLFWESAHWQPTLTPLLTPTVAHLLVPDVAPAPSDPPAWDDEAFVRQMAMLEDHLRGRRFLVHDELTLADLSVAGMATYLPFAAFPFDTWPAFGDWYARIQALPAWRNSAEGPWA